MMSTRRAFLSAGGASAIALSLAACSRSQPKTAETVASGTPIAEPVLNDKQLEEILQRVQTGLAAADKEKSADKLKEVMSGPAARIRAAGPDMTSLSLSALFSLSAAARPVWTRWRISSSCLSLRTGSAIGVPEATVSAVLG